MISDKTHVIEQNYFDFPLIEVSEPNLHRWEFPYKEVPRIPFDHRWVAMDVPEDIWITDTTFRDGQQARPPFTVDQVVALYKMLSRLGGPKGIVRQCEFFLYSKQDREAVNRCRDLGLRFPEITGWIRAKKEDFRLVKEMGLKETGILTSCSDYHIFLKMGLDRRKAFDQYKGIVADALAEGIIPRCHFEDITRADLYGFVLPLTRNLMELSKEAGIPVKIRLCDTLGLGVPYPNAATPRSVPKIVFNMLHYGHVPPTQLEWHGHNDFHKALINASTAWLHGCCAANGTLLGFGERTGNTPIEALIMDYIQLRGRTDGIETTIIKEISDFLQNETGMTVPPNTPFVGSMCNATSAGIHIDGMLKNPEIYNIFDTGEILAMPPGVVITDKSGVAGILHWIKARFPNLDGEITKKTPGVLAIADWVTTEYDNGRITSISDAELLAQVCRNLPEIEFRA